MLNKFFILTALFVTEAAFADMSSNAKASVPEAAMRAGSALNQMAYPRETPPTTSIDKPKNPNAKPAPNKTDCDTKTDKSGALDFSLCKPPTK